MSCNIGCNYTYPPYSPVSFLTWGFALGLVISVYGFGGWHRLELGFELELLNGS